MLSYQTVGGRGVFLLLVNFFFKVLFSAVSLWFLETSYSFVWIFLNVILEQMIKYFLKYLNKEHRIIGHNHSW